MTCTVYLTNINDSQSGWRGLLAGYDGPITNYDIIGRYLERAYMYYSMYRIDSEKQFLEVMETRLWLVTMREY